LVAEPLLTNEEFDKEALKISGLVYDLAQKGTLQEKLIYSIVVKYVIMRYLCCILQGYNLNFKLFE